MAKPKFSWGQEFDDYLNSLSEKNRAKFSGMIIKIESLELSDSIRKERVKKLTQNIFEIRVRTSEHWMRGCYFQITGNEYYITHGFNKKTTKTPKRELSRAIQSKNIFFKIKFRRDNDEPNG